MTANHTCPFPGCTEPPVTETTMWAYTHPAKIGDAQEVLIVSVPVCAGHKRENEGSLD